jgi:alpha-1,2-mannosyltransferase
VISHAPDSALAPRSLSSDRRLLGAVLVLSAASWVTALFVLLGSDPNGMIDLRVYRTGGLAWLDGFPLYDESFPGPLPGPALPFTYPPIAAVLFAGLAVLPWWIAVAVVVGTGVAGLALACRLAADRLVTRWLDGSGAQAMVLAALAVAVAPLLEPVHETVSFGQVNLLLLGVIAADCLLPRTPWPRGIMIGLAAAIKLTPAAFVLFFIARRQWRPVLAAVGAFVAAGLAGLLFAPSDTRQYWFGVLLDPGRIGGLEFTSNQSLRGMLHRFGLPAEVETLGWLGLSAVVGVLALAGVGWLRRRGDDLAALLVTASAALLVSPVSWTHHWVWVVLGLLWLGVLASRSRSPAVVALTALVLAVFTAAPQWWLPYRDHRELSWSWWQHLVGNVYLAGALAVVVTAAVVALRERSGHDRSPREHPLRTAS